MNSAQNVPSLFKTDTSAVFKIGTGLELCHGRLYKNTPHRLFLFPLRLKIIYLFWMCPVLAFLVLHKVLSSETGAPSGSVGYFCPGTTVHVTQSNRMWSVPDTAAREHWVTVQLWLLPSLLRCHKAGLDKTTWRHYIFYVGRIDHVSQSIGW